MTTENIKIQLISYNREFKQNSGYLKSLEVIFNYINFLKSEPYLKNILSSDFDYVNEQLEKIDKILENGEKTKEINNIKIDLADPSTLSKLSIFEKEIKIAQQRAKDEEDCSIMIALPVYLNNLVMAAEIMQDIKDSQKAGDQKRVDEFIEIAKELAFSFVPTKNIKGIKPKVITSAQYLDSSMEMVNKYLIDKIDVQAFLDRNKPKKTINFDKNQSILYIRGQAIKITRKSDNSTDHFILEAIFDNPDKTEETYFKDIAQDYIKIEEYDSSKDWNRFRNACDRLNQKIENATNGQYKRFIEYSTGKTGWSKINPKYL